ncbi:GTPase Era [Caballeronia catudaia]|uniref:GTPase Era n=2 Tax=Caballeronia catudaia TaxID=1777136 RepID=A0A158A0H6_9BURK|nr:GTPase Era [Caballeronia catudaia]
MSAVPKLSAPGVTRDKLAKEIQDRVNRIRSYTPKAGVFGNSGVGKSSLCNALFGREVAKVADVKACTREPQTIFVGAEHGKGGIDLIDVPGIGEDPTRHKEYIELYKSLTPNLDLILWAIKADDRNYASAIEGYEQVRSAGATVPIIFVITQVDKTNDIEDWDHQAYAPGGTQRANIRKKELEVSKKFDVSARNIISIAASKKGRSFNLTSLVDLIVEALPNEKKYAFTREAKEENVSEEARISAEKGIWESIKDFAGEAWDTLKPLVVDVLIASAPKLLSSLKNWISRTDR